MDDIISSIYPKQKRQKKEHVDHISDLPDQTLTHILSYLSTKDAVQTSLLAKRYQKLWAAAPILDFDFHDFLPSIEEAEEGSHEYEDEEKFVKFIDGVLEQREPLTLESFRLVWIDEHSDPTPATRWLDIVAKLKPKILTAVIFTEGYNFQVPDSVFTSGSLQELVLELAYEAISPKSVNIPCLKRLTLKCIEIGDGEMEKLLSGLSALEEMVLHDCILDSTCISSATLKHMVLDGCHNETIYPPDILISIPSLASLEINIRDIGILKFKNLESLVKVNIHFEEFSDEEPLFLTALSNVASLELVLSISAQMDMKALFETKITRFPDFRNLKTLKVGGWCMIHDFDLVARFLLHAPYLKKLTLLHREAAAFSDIEINLQLGNCLDILKINHDETNKSANEVVNSVKTHFLNIREANTILSD